MFVSLWLIETKAVGLLIGFLFTDVGCAQAIIFWERTWLIFISLGTLLLSRKKETIIKDKIVTEQTRFEAFSDNT